MLQKFPPNLRHRTVKFRQSPWKAHLAYARCPSPELRDWLLGRQSLTHKLVALSAGHFRVQVLSQKKGKASLNESRVLGIHSNAVCLLREVILWGCNQPWVFARSVLPLSSLQGRLRHLRKQGNKPLGAYLFQQPDLRRSVIETAQFARRQTYIPKNLMVDTSVWGRRSIFYLDRKPLLVSEVFLSAFPVAKNLAQQDHYTD